MIISWSVMLQDKLLHFVLILFITALSAFHIHLAFWIRHLQTYILCAGMCIIVNQPLKWGIF